MIYEWKDLRAARLPNGDDCEKIAVGSKVNFHEVEAGNREGMREQQLGDREIGRRVSKQGMIRWRRDAIRTMETRLPGKIKTPNSF